jgi:Rod binding domain-containing protein
MGSSMIGLGGMGSQASAQQAQESRTLQELTSMRGGTSSATKIEKGSKQFEEMLLSNWLQQAEQSFATVPGADDDDDQDKGGKDQMLGLGVQSLAQAMEASGGIGIAKMIAKAMTSQADKASTGQSADSGAGSEKGSQ